MAGAVEDGGFTEEVIDSTFRVPNVNGIFPDVEPIALKRRWLGDIWKEDINCGLR